MSTSQSVGTGVDEARCRIINFITYNIIIKRRLFQAFFNFLSTLCEKVRVFYQKSVFAKGFKRQRIAFFAETEYNSRAYGRKHGLVTVVLSGMYVRKMNLDKRLGRNGGNSVVNGYRLMGVCAGVYYGAVVIFKHRMNGVDNFTLDIRLKKINLCAKLLAKRF